LAPDTHKALVPSGHPPHRQSANPPKKTADAEGAKNGGQESTSDEEVLTVGGNNFAQAGFETS